MRGVVIHAPKDLRIEEAPSQTLGPRDVRVRIQMGGICGSDSTIQPRRHRLHSTARTDGARPRSGGNCLRSRLRCDERESWRARRGQPEPSLRSLQVL